MNSLSKYTMFALTLIGLFATFALKPASEVSAQSKQYAVCIDVSGVHVNDGFSVDRDGLADLYLNVRTLFRSYRSFWGTYFNRNRVDPEGQWNDCYPIMPGVDVVTLSLRDHDNGASFDTIDVNPLPDQESIVLIIYPQQCFVQGMIKATGQWDGNVCTIGAFRQFYSFSTTEGGMGFRLAIVYR